MPDRPEAIALISGGKDSLLALYHAIANGYNIVALGNLHPPTTAPSTATYTTDAHGTTIFLPSALTPATTTLGPPSSTSDELDSYMYQTIGHTLLPLYAQCLNLPLYRRPITGGSINTQLDYAPRAGDGDETEDLTLLLTSVRALHPNIVAVTSGAILSTYQRTRIESVCVRLGLTSLAYLWQMQQESVLAQLAALEFDARIVKVATLGLDEDWLWRNVADEKVVARLARLKERWGINPAGEGGEYETLVVSAPGWRGRIVVPEDAMVVRQEGGGAAWVGFMAAGVEPVEGGAGVGQLEWVQALKTTPLLDPEYQALLERLPTPPPSTRAPPTTPTPDATSLTPSIQHTLTTTHISNLVSSTPFPTLAAELSNILTTLTTLIAPRPLTDLTQTTLLLRTMTSFAPLNAAYAPHFTLPLPPARVCVAVPGLPENRNIMLSATLPAPTPHRLGLHVQSRSYWAPANIGPYSQAVRSGGWWEVAGQIPLVPRSMEVVREVREGAVLALQHLDRIWEAVGAVGCAGVAWVVGEEAVAGVLGAWGGRGRVMVVEAEELPRGAGVE